MIHTALLAVMILLVGVPIYQLQVRGGPGARSAYARACTELERQGRTAIRASFLKRLLGIGPIELDHHGFTVNGWSRRTYAWAEIRQPFSIVTLRTNNFIIFHVLVRKSRLRGFWGRVVRNDTTAFTEVRCHLPSSYAELTRRPDCFASAELVLVTASGAAPAELPWPGVWEGRLQAEPLAVTRLLPGGAKQTKTP